MKIALLFVSLFLFLIPYTYLERAERRKFPVIKRGGFLSKTYQAFDWLFIALLLGALVSTNYIPRLDPALVMVSFTCMSMLKAGIYAGLTGKFPYPTRGGAEFFYTDYSNALHRHRLTVQSLGWVSAVCSMVVLSFVVAVW